MRKLFVVLLALGFMFMAGSVYAKDDVLDTYTHVSDGGRSEADAIPASTISTDDYIYGWTLTTTDGTNGYAGLYDVSASGDLTDAQATQQISNSNMIVENEVSSTNPSLTVWFKNPIQLDDQLVIGLGSAPCIVTIYFEDVSVVR